MQARHELARISHLCAVDLDHYVSRRQLAVGGTTWRDRSDESTTRWRVAHLESERRSGLACVLLGLWFFASGLIVFECVQENIEFSFPPIADNPHAQVVAGACRATVRGTSSECAMSVPIDGYDDIASSQAGPVSGPSGSTSPTSAPLGRSSAERFGERLVDRLDGDAEMAAGDVTCAEQMAERPV